MDRMKIAAIFADQEQLGGKEITVLPQSAGGHERRRAA